MIADTMRMDGSKVPLSVRKCLKPRYSSLEQRNAVEMFDEPWSRTSRLTVMKCWIKSQCLQPNQVEQYSALIQDLSVAYNDLDEQNITVPDPINPGEISDISNDLSVIQILNVLETPLSEILDEVTAVENLLNLATLSNTPASFDREPSRSQISNA